MVAKKDIDSKKKNDKKAKGKKGSQTKKTASSAAWGAFTTATIYTIVLMWVLFPFYSWQLQIIYDQARCIDPGATGCPLPYNKDRPPYCPGPKAGGCRETVSGPDSLTAVIEFFTHTLQQIYEIITGIAWIKVDEAVTKMEKKVKSGPKQKTGEGMKHIGGGKHARARKNHGVILPGWDRTHDHPYGAAVDIAEHILNTSIGSDIKSEQSAKCCDKILQYEGIVQQEKCKPGFSVFDVEPFKSIFPKDFGWPYTYLFNPQKKDADGRPIPGQYKDTKYDPNGTPDESAPSRWVGAWFAKTQQRSWSASRSVWSMILMLFYPFIHEELDNIEVEIRIKKFIDALDKKITELEATSNTSSAEGATSSPETKTERGNIEMTRGSNKEGGGGIKDSQCSSKGTDSCVKKLKKIQTDFKRIQKVFEAKFPEKDGKFRGGSVGVRKKLYDSMKPYFEQGRIDAQKASSSAGGKKEQARKERVQEQTARMKSHEVLHGEELHREEGIKQQRTAHLSEIQSRGQQQMEGGASDGSFRGVARKIGKKFNKAGRAIAKTAKNPSDKDVDNIFLDFYVAATKPPQHGRTQSGKEKKSHWGRFFNPFGGDTRYWMRYLITWYMPILTMILMTVAMFTGFWFTAFSSINRYSNFILPLMGAIWIAFTNMFAQPTSVFTYMLFGGSSKHRDSSECPYDSGIYQMRRNMKQYSGLNIYITVAIIVTHLGFALVADGHKTLGTVLSMLFPIYTLVILILKLFHWLWYLA